VFSTFDRGRDSHRWLPPHRPETRVATLEVMLVTARARPTPNEDEIAELEKELKIAKAAVEEYDGEHPR
jgi:hypothetical protein